MHAVASGEDALEVGEDVIGRECDELAPTPIHLAEQVVGIEPVGEVDDEPYHWSVGVGTLLHEVEHGRRARREVVEARTEEPPCKLSASPPAGERPHAERFLDDDVGGVPPFRHGGRRLERRPVVLHLARFAEWNGFGFWGKKRSWRRRWICRRRGNEGQFK